jgi:protein-tyrosine phosphatase
VVDGRDLDWDGAVNVRDLGGLPAAGGRTTRRGAFVRAASPQGLSPAGWAALRAHGVRTCVDLRSSFEVRAHPYTVPAGGVARVAAPWEEGLLEDPEFRSWSESGLLACALYYEPFLRRWPERTAAVVRSLAAAGPGGVLYHCQGGRDRTGLLTILLLALVGVPAEVIVEDRFRLRVAPDDPQRAVEQALYATAGTTGEATVLALLADLDVEDYLRAAGVEAEVVAGLRDRLVTR